MAYVRKKNSKSRARLSVSVKNSRNSLSRARHPASALEPRSTLRCGCNARRWLRIWFPICQLVQYPVLVEVIECVPIHTLCGSSLYTLEVFDGEKYGAMFFRMKWRKQEKLLDRVKIGECSFAICGIYDITVAEVVG